MTAQAPWGPRLLVTGAESAGTKATARILVEAGAKVLHRSTPHGYNDDGSRHWPDLRLGQDYSVVVSRDPFCCAKSQVEAEHASTTIEAFKNMQRAYRHIVNQLDDYLLVTYESMFEPLAVQEMCEFFGLDYSKVETKMFDGNQKYRGGAYLRDQRPVEGLTDTERIQH